MTYLYLKTTASPIGALQLVATDKGLSAIMWDGEDGRRVRLGPFVSKPNHPILMETEKQLKEYFAGDRKRFAVPLNFQGTPFQRRVWEALLTIPWGETRSYRQIAAQIGHPRAFRAVGAANGRNPISIIAPCHRVIGSNGKLTGFAGGLDAKALLLCIEQVKSAQVPKASSLRHLDGLNQLRREAA